MLKSFTSLRMTRKTDFEMAWRKIMANDAITWREKEGNVGWAPAAVLEREKSRRGRLLSITKLDDGLGPTRRRARPALRWGAMLRMSILWQPQALP